MAGQDKKVGISVDTSAINQLRQSAGELAQEMIRSSRAYSTSAKEVLRDLDEQIARIEKRNRLEQEGQKMNLQAQLQTKQITPEQYRSQVGQVSLSGRQDATQIALLREVIDTIKATAKEEIRENRSAVEERVRRDKRVTQLDPTGNIEENLKRTIQRDLLGTVGEAETEERNRFRDYAKSTGAGINRTLGTVAGSQNEFFMAAAALALIPMVGQGLSAMGNRVIGAADRYGKGLGRYGSLMGTSIDIESANLSGTGSGLASLGLSKAEAVEKAYAYQKTGALKLRGNDMLSLLGAERTLGIDQATLSQVVGVRRFDKFGVKASGENFWSNDVTTAINILEKSSNNNNAILQELLGTYTKTANQILSITGRVDSSGVAQSIMGIRNITGFEGQQLDRTMSSIQGIGRSNNPITRSLMLSAYREANPEASLFQIRAMMEDPLSRSNIGATSSMFGKLEKITGGGDMMKFALQQQLGLSFTDIEQMFKKGGKLSDLANESNKEWKQRDYSAGAEKFVWKGERSTKELESFMGDTGKVVVDFMDKMIGEVKSFIEGRFGSDETYSQKNEEVMTRAFEKALANDRMKNKNSWAR